MMGSIPDWAADVLQEAKETKLQDDFDRFMIDMWFDNPARKTKYQLESFLFKHSGCRPNHRFPTHPRQTSVYISRFFAAFLPKTSNVLFQTMDRDKALAIMKNEKLLVFPCDAVKNQREVNEIIASKKRMNIACKERLGFDDFKDKSNSNWRTCK